MKCAIPLSKTTKYRYISFNSIEFELACKVFSAQIYMDVNFSASNSMVLMDPQLTRFKILFGK